MITSYRFLLVAFGFFSTFYQILSLPVEEDLTQFVDAFIGTYRNLEPGNVFPGASVPFGMAKVGIDVDDWATAGYISNPNAKVTSMSLFHDSGTGGNQSFGNFGSMPIECNQNDVKQCGVLKEQRKIARQTHGKDVNDVILVNDQAKPGYFATYLQDQTILEATSTRRASLLRYTWNSSDSKPFITFDWTQNKGTISNKAHVEIKRDKFGFAQQILFNATFLSAWAEPQFTYESFACFDLTANGKQVVDQFAIWSAKDDNHIDFQINQTEAGSKEGQKGVIISFVKGSQTSGNTQILLRAGISFISPQQACQNAKEEIPEYDFENVVQKAKQLWQEKLERIQLDKQTDPKIKKLFYTSFYRSFLSPNNATNEAPGLYKGTIYPYFDGMYCSWDVFRTFYPLLSLTSPQEYADIVQSYVDSWRKEGFVIECRANTCPGFVQGGSDGTNILADFAVKYRNANVGVNMQDLYDALWHDATHDSKTFAWGGRQIAIYEKYGYLPSDYIEPNVQGLQRFQTSKTAGYVFNDFGIRNVALLLGKTQDAERLTKRALFYKNVFDPTVKSLGFQTFMQKRKMNGEFDNEDPTWCSPEDTEHFPECGYSYQNSFGFYESSSWEYSYFVPHDIAGLINLVSNTSFDNFIKRTDTFFQNKLFFSADEPSFQAPLAYHYANAPSKSVDRVRQIILNEFNLTIAGIPGNDDNGAMASLAIFHLLGLYPVPSTREFLIVSPFMPGYTIHNTLFGSVTVTVNRFDPSTLENGGNLTNTSKAYVKSVKINGVQQTSRCKIEFDQLFPAAASKMSIPQDTQIVFEMGTSSEVQDCGPSPKDLPSSMSTGGFSSF